MPPQRQSTEPNKLIPQYKKTVRYLLPGLSFSELPPQVPGSKIKHDQPGYQAKNQLFDGDECSP